MKAAKCKHHPNREVMSKCGWCEKEICADCITYAKGKKFCVDCTNRFQISR